MTHVALVACYLLVLSSVAAFAPSANTRSRFTPSTSVLSMSKYGGGKSPSDVYGSESFQEHLPELLKRGLSERPDYELPKLMRARYEKMVAAKKEASRSISGFNLELSEELSELAAEMDDTSHRFVESAENWDAWDRPDPELPNQLRAKAFPAQGSDETDPNYAEHLEEFLTKGRAERPDPDYPTELRRVKEKAAAAKRAGAVELRKVATRNEALAAELEESHERFEAMVSGMKARDDFRRNRVE